MREAAIAARAWTRRPFSPNSFLVTDLAGSDHHNLANVSLVAIWQESGRNATRDELSSP
jgi:hypothetical protein